MAVQTLSRRSPVALRTNATRRSRWHAVTPARTTIVAPPLEEALFRVRAETMDPQEAWMLRAHLGLLGR